MGLVEDERHRLHGADRLDQSPPVLMQAGEQVAAVVGRPTMPLLVDLVVRGEDRQGLVRQDGERRAQRAVGRGFHGRRLELRPRRDPLALDGGVGPSTTVVRPSRRAASSPTRVLPVAGGRTTHAWRKPVAHAASSAARASTCCRRSVPGHPVAAYALPESTAAGYGRPPHRPVASDT